MNYLEKREWLVSYENATTTIPACNALMTSRRLWRNVDGQSVQSADPACCAAMGLQRLRKCGREQLPLGRMDARQMIEASGGDLRYLRHTIHLR